MSKRKAGLSDIIYELDNEDAVLSSEDEGKNPKNPRLQPDSSKQEIISLPDSDEKFVIVDSIDSTTDETNDCELIGSIPNGGKTSDSAENSAKSSQENDKEADSTIVESNDTQISDDVINSPVDSDLGVVGCENRTPLVTIKFRDKKMANSYKRKVKAFMLSLIKLHEVESDDLCDSETDLELDVWPEDLLDEEPKMEEAEGMFFVDTAPGVDCDGDIPRYSQASTLISNIEDKQPSPPPTIRRGPTCFNCNGAHALRECPKPRDNARINENRKNMVTRVGRYHVEDEQKYGHLIPGRISGNLRHALGLKRHEIPIHIYRMRQLGYPPGWLEEARISHSGITMFDSTGSAILDPEEEEGEVCEPGSKDKFDIKKIIDFPGFNVPVSSRYKEEAHLLNMPPMSEEDSKMLMLQMLAPNAMKAYKRKKLTMFPSSGGAPAQEGQAEMELDSGDEATEFPSVPPLPDEAPPPVPPPPSNPPPPPENPPPPPENPPPPPENPPPPPENPPPPPENPHPPNTSSLPEESLSKEEKGTADDSDDLEVISVTQVKDIPMPEGDAIVIDDDDDNKSQDINSARNSPSLDDLVYRKQLLLKQLDGDSISQTSTDKEDITSQEDATSEILTENVKEAETETVSTPSTSQTEVVSTPFTSQTEVVSTRSTSQTEVVSTPSTSQTEVVSTPFTSQTEVVSTPSTSQTEVVSTPFTSQTEVVSTPSTSQTEVVATPSTSKTEVVSTPFTSQTEVPKTPDMKPTGHVKTTLYGTPILNTASPYLKLPSDNNFAKDICDVINFENLPNSTGKYKKICSLLKKVKRKVDRIQDS